ncbi:MAG TPA: ribbon-helix-helix protein, CopG family [Thermoanaerobaculia bacterium]|nr:ribbon-helix-helix protein, CopG family [Thermoanaerobaculia bacterium]
MRTTIDINDAVLEQLKARASREGTTVNHLIEESVRLYVGGSFELVTFGKDGQFTSLDADRVSALIEHDDIERRR